MFISKSICSSISGKLCNQTVSRVLHVAFFFSSKFSIEQKRRPREWLFVEVSRALAINTRPTNNDPTENIEFNHSICSGFTAGSVVIFFCLFIWHAKCPAREMAGYFYFKIKSKQCVYAWTNLFQVPDFKCRTIIQF